MTCSISNHNLFYIEKTNNKVTLIFYANNLFLIEENIDVILWIKKKLQVKFKITNLR